MPERFSFQAPQNIHDLIEDFIEAFKEALGNNLVGIYLHGSLAMGCFNPESSDIDILIVIKQILSKDKKQELANLILDFIDRPPANGIEVSVVTLESMQHFQYPTPFELHYSHMYKNEFKNGKIEFSSIQTDPDLAAHIVVVRERGVVLYGKPIADVFSPVPNKYYLHSTIDDVETGLKKIKNGQYDDQHAIPVYEVLNACRTLAFIDDSVIRSKREGGEWGMNHLPNRFRLVISESMKEYARKGSSKPIDVAILKKFGDYCRERIEETQSTLKAI